MMPAPSIDPHSDARFSCWLSVGTAPAYVGPLNQPAIAQPIRSRTARLADAHPSHQPKRSGQELQSKTAQPDTPVNSP